MTWKTNVVKKDRIQTSIESLFKAALNKTSWGHQQVMLPEAVTE